MTSQLSSIQSNIIEHYSSIQSVFKTVDGALTKISSMQSFILNEVMYSHSCIFYYLCCIAVILLVSLSPSYSSARLNTLGLIVFNMLVEKFLTALNLDWYINVDRLRWIFLLLIGFSFFISYQRYQRQREEMFLSLVRATSRIENDMRPSRIKDMMWSVMKRRPEGVMWLLDGVCCLLSGCSNGSRDCRLAQTNFHRWWKIIGRIMISWKKDQYLRRMLSTSASIRMRLRESLKATSEATREAASYASSLDLLKTFSVSILLAANSAAILDLLRASSVAMREAATSAANLDLLRTD